MPFCPFRSTEGNFEAAPPATKKRRVGSAVQSPVPLDVFREERSAAPTAVSDLDFYRLHDVVDDENPPQVRYTLSVRRANAPQIIKIDLENMSKMLSAAKSAESLHIIVCSLRETDKADKIVIRFKSSNTITEAEVSLLEHDPETDKMFDIPPLEADYVVTMNSEMFMKSVREIVHATESELITFRMINNVLTMNVIGDNGSMYREIRPDSKDNIEFTQRDDESQPDDYKQVFSARHIETGCKASSEAKLVSIYLLPNMPIKLHFPVPDLCDVIFYLGPKLEPD